VTNYVEKAEVLYAFFALFFTGKASSLCLVANWGERGTAHHTGGSS